MMAKKNNYRGMVTAVTLALVAIAVVAVIARRTFFRYEFALVTYVGDSAGITPSSPVLLHGISIGHVRRVTLSGSKDPNRTVRIDMLFSRTHLGQIPEDSTIAIAASNLLGDKSLDISRGTHAMHISPDAEIPSTATQDINSVLDRGKVPLKQVDNILDHVDRILQAVNHGAGSVGLLVNDQSMESRINGIKAGIEQLQARFNAGHGALMSTRELEIEAKKPIARMNDILAEANHGRGTVSLLMHDPNTPTLAADAGAARDEAQLIYDFARKSQKFPELVKHVQRTGDKASALLSRMENGKGSAALLLSSSQLSDSLKSIDTEFDSFVADFAKHPRRFVALRLF